MTEKLVFTASLLEIQYERDNVNQAVKFALFVAPLVKTLKGIPPVKCSRQMAGNSKASSCSALIASVISG